MRASAPARRGGPRSCDALGLGLEIVADPRQRRHPAGQGAATASSTRVVLASAGLRRLGRAGEVTEILDPIQMLPAPAQGALAVECRADDADAALGCARRARRRRQSGRRSPPNGRCSPRSRPAARRPVGALAEVAEGDDGRSKFSCVRSVTAVDGSDAVRLSATGTDHRCRGSRAAAGRRAAGLGADGVEWRRDQ